MSSVNELKRLKRDLMVANRILGHEDVVDTFGHVSVRHPDRADHFLLSRARSPELVAVNDIMEFDLTGECVDKDDREPYIERFIHSAIYEARPDVNAVIHSHADDVLPFTVTEVPLRPVLGAARSIGKHIPVWDIDEDFGNATNMLVRNIEQGRALAKRLGENNVVLMRGHGFAAAASSLLEAVSMAVYMPRNAKILINAMSIGTPKLLSDHEIGGNAAGHRGGMGNQRAWEYWSTRAGLEYEPGGYAPKTKP
jgi:ribulose-5-phosphate 4-epimerase/fuculose-1-phosphate aldolase